MVSSFLWVMQDLYHQAYQSLAVSWRKVAAATSESILHAPKLPFLTVDTLAMIHRRTVLHRYLKTERGERGRRHLLICLVALACFPAARTSRRSACLPWSPPSTLLGPSSQTSVGPLMLMPVPTLLQIETVAHTLQRNRAVGPHAIRLDTPYTSRHLCSPRSRTGDVSRRRPMPSCKKSLQCPYMRRLQVHLDFLRPGQGGPSLSSSTTATCFACSTKNPLHGGIAPGQSIELVSPAAETFFALSKLQAVGVQLSSSISRRNSIRFSDNPAVCFVSSTSSKYRPPHWRSLRHL